MRSKLQAIDCGIRFDKELSGPGVLAVVALFLISWLRAVTPSRTMRDCYQAYDVAIGAIAVCLHG